MSEPKLQTEAADGQSRLTEVLGVGMWYTSKVMIDLLIAEQQREKYNTVLCNPPFTINAP